MAPPTPPSTPPAQKQEAAVPVAESGTLSAKPTAPVQEEEAEAMDPYGDMIVSFWGEHVELCLGGSEQYAIAFGLLPLEGETE